MTIMTGTNKQLDLIQVTKDFIKTLETRNSPEEIAAFYHPDVSHTEYPNAVTKNTATRNLQDLKDASQKGKQLMQKERYEIVKLYSFENTVVLEAIWTGTLAIPVGKLPAGGEMKAHFAQFFEFQDGKIIRQRNYDCFEPFT